MDGYVCSQRTDTGEFTMSNTFVSAVFLVLVLDFWRYLSRRGMETGGGVYLTVKPIFHKALDLF